MLNFYYKESIENFLVKSVEEIIGTITLSNAFDTSTDQNKSWKEQISILKSALASIQGTILFEFSVPRMGKRIDVVLIIKNVVFIIEFKVGESKFLSNNVDQVWDYALDLKNFHKPSHQVAMVPILIATEARQSCVSISATSHNDNLLLPIKIGNNSLRLAIDNALLVFKDQKFIDVEAYVRGSYTPTPTIIEAAIHLYNNHSVEDITRRDADVTNLTQTTSAISKLIDVAKNENRKIICFVTGVPGAGKTLVGLDIATSHMDKEMGNSSVYLSGNAPLVAILQEALTRDKVRREAASGKNISKQVAKQAVKSFIQIIHHYRDAYLVNTEAPYDHVAIFDEAQRAWTKEHTVKFMRQKKNQPEFNYSEPEFLISCLDRHKDWALIVCLVGGGQEINTGEAGISEWIYAVGNSFPHWEVHISPSLSGSEYAANQAIESLEKSTKVLFDTNLHLSVSLRSYRAENLALFIRHLLDINSAEAKEILLNSLQNYPVVLTRDIEKAKKWLKEKARGSERYGLVVSSQAQRLKPFAIDVRSPMDPVNWFLNDKNDIRSSFYLEDAATEYKVQGLELDWTCIIWDGDLRYSTLGWKTYSFKGSKWNNIKAHDRKRYLVNAYRVLLTRARQGMIIVVPHGSLEDPTRDAEFYDPTFDYLADLGIPIIK